MKQVLFFLIFISGISSINAQNTKSIRINGYVRDSASGEELIGANVFDESTGVGGITNSYGFFSLNLKPGEHNLSFSFVGYKMIRIDIFITGDTNLSIELPKKSKSGDVVTINANRKDNIRKIDMSTNKLTMQTIKKLPAFLGEIDLVRSIQLLPGVSTVGEGASGFNVRGGGIDQNLVLLDEAPVFNSSHLFGFFSIFNPDAVKDVQLVKAGIPANYGGRLSSILDVRMKEGNKKSFEYNGGIGTIFSRFTAEGPLIKNKASFIVGGRRSYIDVLAKPFLKGDLAGSRFNFYDFTAKVNYTMSPKDKFFISSYFGNDVFSATSAFKFIWGNKTLTARWNHVFSRKIFSNFTYVYSKYNYNLGFGDRDNSFDWYSNIFNNTFKPEFTWYVNQNNTVQFGGQSTYYLFRPGRAKTNTQDFSLPDKFSWENSAYIQNEQKVGKKFQFRYGLRFTSFDYLGKGNAYYYKPSSMGLQRPDFDTAKYFEKNKSIQMYNNFEPRISAKYDINKFSSIKLSYNRMVQNLHLISNTTASVPLDVWTPSTNNIKPELADQYAAGYFRNFGKNDDYEFSSEVYYKDLKNQVDYVNGANLLLNEYLEGELLFGKGRAYGWEVYMKKNTGKLTGWVSYTLSRTERKISTINNSDWYPSRYDRLHNLYLVAIYSPNKKWDFSSNFIYSSGTPNTFPTMQYTFQGLNIPHNDLGTRNNSRISPYIRLDFAATMQGKQREKYSCYWVFSVYNALNRKNAMDVYFRNNDQTGVNEAVRFSVVGSFVPAVSYNFKF